MVGKCARLVWLRAESNCCAGEGKTVAERETAMRRLFVTIDPGRVAYARRCLAEGREGTFSVVNLAGRHSLIVGRVARVADDGTLADGRRKWTITVDASARAIGRGV